MQMKRINLYVIMAVTLLVSALAYPRLPNTIASHWGLDGSANGYMSRFWGLAIVPIIMVVIVGLFAVIPYLDPKRENIQAMRDKINNFGAAILLFLLYIHILTIAWNLGYRFDMTRMLIPAMAALFYAIGSLIATAKQNWFIGIRTPWTLSNERVWTETHRVGGKAFQIAAVLTLGGMLLPQYAIFFILVPILVASFYPIIYSYVLYRKLTKS
jgi:uncharacterized membrane protein